MRSLKIMAFTLAVTWAALAIAGCAVLGGTSSPAEVTTVAGAENAYTAAANLETAWLNSGLATKAQAAVAKSLEASVYADVVTARTAVANKDSAAIAVGLKLFNQALPEFTAYIANHGGANVQPK